MVDKTAERAEGGRSMNEMKVFENADFGKVRTIVQDGEP